MPIDIRPHRHGKAHCLGLALLLLSGCRSSVPPKIEICIGDGFGGADCVETDGSQLYRSPSSLKNYWMTSQGDEQNLAEWCYATSAVSVSAGMREIEHEIGERHY